MKSLCTACNTIFNSMAGFDGHRTGSYGEPIYHESPSGKTREVVSHTPPDRRCLTPDEMQAKGWSQNEKGWWITSQREGAGLPVEDGMEEETIPA